MIIEWTYLIYLLLFGSIAGLGTGLFDLGFFSNEDDLATAESQASVDFVSGTDGDDDIVAETADTAKTYDLGAGDDTLVATAGDDVADGGIGDDTLSMGAGDDAALGGDGNDNLLGGNGDDILSGEAGDDVIAGHGGDDILSGGLGNDILEGGYGDDTLFGGAGDDILSGDTLNDPDNMGRGIDVIDGGAGNDNIFLGDGDIGTGGEGADIFSVYEIMDPDQPAANITDYDAEMDQLFIQYYETADPVTGQVDDPELDVSYDADADLTLVTLNGQEIATLSGDARVTADDITLTPITQTEIT